MDWVGRGGVVGVGDFERGLVVIDGLGMGLGLEVRRCVVGGLRRAERARWEFWMGPERVSRGTWWPG